MIVGKLYRKAEKVVYVKDMPSAPKTEAKITIKLLEPGMRQKAFNAGYEIGVAAEDLSSNVQSGIKILNGATEFFVYKNCITSWSGFYEDEAMEKEFKCTPQNIIKLAALCPELVNFVATEHGKLAEETTKIQEEATKNS